MREKKYITMTLTTWANNTLKFYCKNFKLEIIHYLSHFASIRVGHYCQLEKGKRKVPPFQGILYRIKKKSKKIKLSHIIIYRIKKRQKGWLSNNKVISDRKAGSGVLLQSNANKILTVFVWMNERLNESSAPAFVQAN